MPGARMLSKTAIFAVAFVAAVTFPNVHASDPLAAGQLEVLNAAGEVVLRVNPTKSSSDVDLPEPDSDAADILWPVVQPVDTEGCQGVPTLATPSVVLLDRGTCSFVDKVEAASAAGAPYVLIAQSIDGIYNETSGRIKNACYRDCDKARGTTELSCMENIGSSCGSKTCIALNQFEPVDDVDDKNNFCCMEDALQALGGVFDITTTSAMFISYGDATLLRAKLDELGDGATVRLQDRPILFPNPSVYFMWCLGTGITAFASYHALSRERKHVRGTWSRKARDQVADVGSETTSEVSSTQPRKRQEAPLEILEISSQGAIGFLVMSSVVLVGLFYLTLSFPHTAVIVLNVFYAIGSVASLSLIIFQPIIGRLVPKLFEPIIYEKPSWELKVNGVEFVSTLFAITWAFTWLAFRHEDWSWVMLNISSFALCCMFLTTLRLPSLKEGLLLFVLFIIYDIFMVFISPSIFGSSVMVDVATAGAASSEATNDVCVRNQAERVPMLIMFPRFGDYTGGFALLGLGDILIPGLMIVLALRLDYSRLFASPVKTSWIKAHTYYLSCMVAYGSGLILTYIANLMEWTINDVKGQPALLYLVPFVGGTFFIMTKYRGDYKSMMTHSWNAMSPANRQVQTERAELARSIDLGSNSGSSGEGEAAAATSTADRNAAAEVV